MIRLVRLVLAAALLAVPGAHAADLDRTAVDFTPPGEIKWVRNAAGTNESATFDPNATVPAPAGSHVIHYAGKVHYDEETIIQVWGMGPATSTPAEKR